MSTVKRAPTAYTQRIALAKAIGSVVDSMDLAGLRQLADVLNVPVPSAAKVARARERTRPSRSSDREERILSGSGVGPVVSASEGSRILDAIAVDDDSADWARSELLGAGELVSRLEISRGTLDNWRKAGKIIAFRKGLRNFLYPMRQFKRLQPIEGLDLVAPFFPSPEEAWEWLVAPNRMTGGEPPIDKLRDGEVALVTKAAEGALDYA